MTTFAERLAALPELDKSSRLTVHNLNRNIAGATRTKALEARLRLAVELLEAIQRDDMSDLRKSLSADIRALVAKVKGELAA